MSMIWICKHCLNDNMGMSGFNTYATHCSVCGKYWKGAAVWVRVAVPVEDLTSGRASVSYEMLEAVRNQIIADKRDRASAFSKFRSTLLKISDVVTEKLP